MRLIGSRYATFRTEIDSYPCVVKAMDVVLDQRRPVRCYREWLGQKIATRLGLAVPETTLVELHGIGRVSMQRWIDGAHPLSVERRRALVHEVVGIRILLLDLLIANRDRSEANLLQLGDTVFPIDFNVAFSFADTPPRVEKPSLTAARWLGIDGMLTTRPTELDTFLSEVARAQHLIADHYLRFIVGAIPEIFISSRERERLLAGLEERRALLGQWISEFWRETIEPLHRLTELST